MHMSMYTITAVALACISTVSAYSDADILNFALNLECLEAEYYLTAVYGTGLTEAERGGGPVTLGGRKAKLGEYSAIAVEIAMDEMNHVNFLRAALGDAAVPCPLINIGSAFSVAADVALGTTLKPPFSPYDGFINFLFGALLFEDVGVTAYNGAIGVITTPAYQAAARSIMAVEAYHAGIIRSMLSENYDVIVEPYGAPVSAILTAVGTLLGELLELPAYAFPPVGDITSNPHLLPLANYSLANAVSPAQVLNVVYGSFTATKGLFFPNGVNGLLGETRGSLTACTGTGTVTRFGQCGGMDYTGTTCCEGYNTCTKINDYYSQCTPTPVPAGMVGAYGTCGGMDYKGSTTCEPGTTCVVVNTYYSQCQP